MDSLYYMMYWDSKRSYCFDFDSMIVLLDFIHTYKKMHDFQKMIVMERLENGLYKQIDISKV